MAGCLGGCWGGGGNGESSYINGDGVVHCRWCVVVWRFGVFLDVVGVIFCAFFLVGWIGA